MKHKNKKTTVAYVGSVAHFLTNANVQGLKKAKMMIKNHVLKRVKVFQI